VSGQAGLGFGGLLRRLRDEAGLTQEELAEAARVSQRAVSDLERGINRTARKDTALLLAGALGLAGPTGEMFVAAARGKARASEVLGAFTHNLPVQLTSFIGRDAELGEVRALLTDNRLVTLTGAGGAGKTRLALQVAAGMLTEFPAGIWQVDLAPLTDPALVAVAVARALGLPDQQGVPTMATVTSFLGAGRALVVLDNCEHLLQACAVLAEDLLRACPGLVIVATSREPVGVAGEATWRVPSLALAGDAIALFADRARRARPGFVITPENTDAVAEICRRLDGMPLAIELAAARLRAFAPGEIAAGLHDRFRLLTGGSRTAVRRQQTLRASVDWSHALLTEPERILFRRLAAFAGGFGLPAADAVAAGDSLERHQVLDLLALLVDKSLVTAEESRGVTRYRLPETIRQYAAEKLSDSGEAGTVRTRHRDHYAAMAAGLDPLASRQIARMEADIDNLRAAFRWSVELSDHESALRLASSMQPLWLGRGRMLEGLAWFDAALTGQPAGAEPVGHEVWVRAVTDAAALDRYTGTPPRRMAEVENGVAMAREIGDPLLLSRALAAAGCAACICGGEWRPYLDEAVRLARQAADARTLAEILAWQAYAAGISADPVVARGAAQEGLALAEQTGSRQLSQNCRLWLGIALIWQGDLHSARSLLSDLAAEAEAHKALAERVVALGVLGQALALLGQPAEARTAGEATIAIADDLGLPLHASVGYMSLAYAAMADGEPEALRKACRAVFGGNLSGEAEADLATGELPAARQHADEAIAAATRAGSRFMLIWALLTSARVAAAAGDAARARDDAYQALTNGHDIESRTGIIDALECLGGLARDAEDQHKAVRLLGAADAVRQTTGYQRYQLHQTRYDAAVLELRSSLGDAAFSQAWNEGGALTTDDAVTYALRGRRERSRPAAGWPSLTPAERDVARLVAEGLANKDIAARLFVSPRTVQTHLTHMYGKLGVSSRVQLAQEAARHA
jgi:predicted ATPase/DNA-binding CsgD family transcriptional regulator/DNA-binding XRE family transcriptional regulator